MRKEFGGPIQKNRYAVDIICFKNNKKDYDEVKDGIKIYKMKMRPLIRLSKFTHNCKSTYLGKILYILFLLLYRIKKVLLFPFYPLSSLLYLYKYYMFVKRIEGENHYSTIISVYNPIEAVITGSLIKKKNSIIKHVIYSLDTLTNKTDSVNILRRWEKKMVWRKQS